MSSRPLPTAGRGKPTTQATSTKTTTTTKTTSAIKSGSGATATAAPAAAAPKPSDRISVQRFDPHKFSDPFASSKKKTITVFATQYQAGAIPCRINHGSVRSTLHWDRPLTDVDYASILQSCGEGIRETEHPFVFVARTAFKELLEADGGPEKAVALVPKLVLSLRAALQDSAPGVFAAALDAIQQLSNAVGPAMNAHLHHVLIQINKKLFDRTQRDRVLAVLETLERNGGPEALAIIKSKVPSYVSVCS